MKIYAYRGEKVTRENGEYICRLSCDVHSGDVPQVDQFEDWQIKKPERHEAFPPYRKGESYIRAKSNFGADLHLERGWASETPLPFERPK
jgi:hypothetical protein